MRAATFIREISEAIVQGREAGPHVVDDLRERWGTQVRVVCRRCDQWWPEGGYYPETCESAHHHR